MVVNSANNATTSIYMLLGRLVVVSYMLLRRLVVVSY